MSEERYKPSEEDIKKAEGMLDPKERAMSDIREEEIDKLRTESGLSQEEFDEIYESFDSENFVQNDFIPCSFRLKGHNIRCNLRKFTGRGPLLAEFIIDRVYITGNKLEQLRKKFEKTVVGLHAISADRIAGEAGESIKDNLADDLL